jgi:hypothetical protein
MDTPDERSPAGERFDIGVAIVPSEQGSPDGAGTVPGYTDTLGRGRLNPAAAAPYLIEKGEEAVRSATEAVAAQIGLAARRIAAAVGEQLAQPPAGAAGAYDLGSVTVAFGITLSAGVQAMFTAQAQSSVQVTITLTPRAEAASGAAPGAP